MIFPAYETDFDSLPHSPRIPVFPPIATDLLSIGESFRIDPGKKSPLSKAVA